MNAQYDADNIRSMTRTSLVRAITTNDWGFPVDLTEDYLHAMDLPKLRHIYQALLARRQNDSFDGLQT